jgi:hypothetical protein
VATARRKHKFEKRSVMHRPRQINAAQDEKLLYRNQGLWPGWWQFSRCENWWQAELRPAQRSAGAAEFFVRLGLAKRQGACFAGRQSRSATLSTRQAVSHLFYKADGKPVLHRLRTANVFQ